jgi:prepilin signal peptidase PulO-like enzyme (type II secretory pathway)
MNAVVMALAGLGAGLVLDAIVAVLGRQPFDHPATAEDDVPGARSIDLSAEEGALHLPALLDGLSPVRRIAVVAVTAAVFALLGLQYGDDPGHALIVAVYASALIVCASTDIIAYRVPNVVTYPAIVGALVIGMTLSGADRLDVVLGGLVFGGLLLLPSLLASGMGMGDVKLALFVGLALGLNLVVPAMLLMAIGGGIAAVALLATRVRGRRDPIPYAPFIAGGALIVILTQGVAFTEL